MFTAGGILCVNFTPRGDERAWLGGDDHEFHSELQSAMQNENARAIHATHLGWPIIALERWEILKLNGDPYSETPARWQLAEYRYFWRDKSTVVWNSVAAFSILLAVWFVSETLIGRAARTVEKDT
jgi:hypothetical protein